MAPKQEGYSGPRALGLWTHKEPQTRAHGDLGLRWESELEFRKSVSSVRRGMVVLPGSGPDGVPMRCSPSTQRLSLFLQPMRLISPAKVCSHCALTPRLLRAL